MTLLGAASSAGAHHAGQELAPAAIRSAGFVERLRAGGMTVEDRGDVVRETFAVDFVRTDARNLDATVRVARKVADAVADAASAGQAPIVVLGGDCTITLGVVAGVQQVDPDAGLVYFDGDADLATPDSGGSGILDAMGIAHLLGLADTELARLGPTFPAIAGGRLAMLGYNEADPDTYRDGLLRGHPDLTHFPDRLVRSKPLETARAALEAVHASANGVIVHFDVDAVDSGDLPLGNFPHYGSGVSLLVAEQVLTLLCASRKLRALVLTEVNPTYDPGGAQLGRYVAAVAASLLKGRSADSLGGAR